MSTLSEKFLEKIEKTNPTENVECDVLIDTNVMLEVYTVCDLLREWDECGSTEAALRSSKYRYRQVRARHSTILAWWLAKQGRIVGLLGNEGVLKLDKLAPKVEDIEDATSFIFTTAVHHVILPLVMPGWRLGAMTKVNHAAKGTHADTEILIQAELHRLPLVTHEGLSETGVNEDPDKLRGRAKACGVQAFSSREYLEAENVNVIEECRQFVAACRNSVHVVQPQNSIFDRFVTEELEPWYRFVLLDEVDPWHPRVPRRCEWLRQLG